MQTFLPYPDFRKSLESLDYRRLGKQRVEARQILQALRNPSYGWQNHPATNMWRGYDDALVLYSNLAIIEWRRRGYKNTMPLLSHASMFELPYWIGDEAFHSSHKSMLVQKDREFYKPRFPNVSESLTYVWPGGKKK